jgi:hypothetical protein
LNWMAGKLVLQRTVDFDSWDKMTDGEREER